MAASTPVVHHPELTERTRQLRDRHRTMLWLSIAILAAAFALRARGSGDIGPAFLPNVSLPVLCGSRALFGIECPGCGLTRSFVALSAGDFRKSLESNRVGWLLALAVVLPNPYRLFALRELAHKNPHPHLAHLVRLDPHRRPGHQLAPQNQRIVLAHVAESAAADSESAPLKKVESRWRKANEPEVRTTALLLPSERIRRTSY